MTQEFRPTTHEYDVQGRTHHEVGQSIQVQRQRLVPEARSAYTRSRLGAEVAVDSERRPTLTRTLEIEIFLPRLVDGGAAEFECFSRHRAELEAHELLHVENARLAATQIVDLFHRVSSLEAFEAGFEELRSQLMEADRQLDRQTDNGGRKCRWPPPDCPHASARMP